MPHKRYRTCDCCGREYASDSTRRMFLCYACSHHGPAGKKKRRDDEDENPFVTDPNRPPDEDDDL